MKQIEGFDHYFIDEIGQVFSMKSGSLKVLKYMVTSDGYCVVTFYFFGISQKFRVHRLVAQTFIPNPNNLPCVCHKDDNPTNNRVENLFWGSHQDNSNDKVRKNRQSKEDNHGRVVLTKEQVLIIKNHKRYYGSCRDLALQFNVTKATISHILHGKNWKHIK